MSDGFMGKGLFITGTDTGVGKTLVAAGLTRLAVNRGLRAKAVKPVETGCPVRSGMLYPEDGALLRDACKRSVTLDECVPFRFSLPASPYRAAAVEGKRIRTVDIIEHVLTLAEEADITVVEGAGGLMVPIDDGFMMIDLIERLSFPVILVGRTGLGTVNHTLLSVAALENRGVRPCGIILATTSPAAGPEEEFTPGDIARLVKGVPVVVLPFLPRETRLDPDTPARCMVDAVPEEVLRMWLSP